MATDRLKEALLRQNTGIEAKNFLDALSKLLEVDYRTVLRVTYAYEQLHADPRSVPALHTTVPMSSSTRAWENDLNPELKEALVFAVSNLISRYAIADAIENKRPVSVNVAALIPASDAAKICVGCPMRMECLNEALYEPIDCYTQHRSRVQVYPLRIVGEEVEVDANQPRGQYTVPLKKFG
jgi:hypothetical protein